MKLFRVTVTFETTVQADSKEDAIDIVSDIYDNVISAKAELEEPEFEKD